MISDLLAALSAALIVWLVNRLIKYTTKKIEHNQYGQWKNITNRLVAIWPIIPRYNIMHIYFTKDEILTGTETICTSYGVEETTVSISIKNKDYYYIGIIGGNKDKGAFDELGRMEYRYVPGINNITCKKWRIEINKSIISFLTKQWIRINTESSKHLIKENKLKGIQYTHLRVFTKKPYPEYKREENRKEWGKMVDRVVGYEHIHKLFIKMKVRGFFKKAFYVPLYLVQPFIPKKTNP